MNETFMVSHSLDNNTHTGHVISLCLNANPLISLIPRMASNFRHLLSCGTMGDETFPKSPTWPKLLYIKLQLFSIL